MTFLSDDLGLLISAITFATDKHQNQRRKGRERPPYINHPIHLLNLLWDIGEVRDIPTLVAAVLHDTLEDTNTTPDELAARFGTDVLAIVQEVTDDKSLPKEERKRLQIEHAPHLSSPAKHIKLADKIDNVQDVILATPADWSHTRLVTYVDWSEAVVTKLRGTNTALETHFDAVVRDAREVLQKPPSQPIKN